MKPVLCLISIPTYPLMRVSLFWNTLYEFHPLQSTHFYLNTCHGTPQKTELWLKYHGHMYKNGDATYFMLSSLQNVCILVLITVKMAPWVAEKCQWSLYNEITVIKPKWICGSFNKFYTSNLVILLSFNEAFLSLRLLASSDWSLALWSDPVRNTAEANFFTTDMLRSLPVSL